MIEADTEFVPDNDNHLELRSSSLILNEDAPPFAAVMNSPVDTSVMLDKDSSEDQLLEQDIEELSGSILRESNDVVRIVDEDEDRKSDAEGGETAVFAKDKNIFVLSWAGRPIFTRYGDDSKLAGFMGVISALISNVQHQKTPDLIKSIICGKMKFVFSIKGPLYFVAVSRKDGESVEKLLEQLDYLNLQILSVLTGGFLKLLESRPTYDLRKLISGTENLMHAMINDFGKDPCYMFNAVRCLRLNPLKRSKIGSILKSSLSVTNASSKNPPSLFSILLAGRNLVSMIRPKDKALHPADLLILINFITNVTSFKSSDSWAPICLPKFNSKGFLYAHVSSFEKDIFFVQLSLQQDAFHTLHLIKDKVQSDLISEGLIQEILDSYTVDEFSVDEIATSVPEFRHFLYKNERLSQFIEPRHLSPFDTAKSKKKLFRRYQHVHSKVHEPKLRHLIYYEVSETTSLFGLVSPGEFEFYGFFSSTVTKEKCIAACNRCLRWILREEPALFITASPTW